MDRSLTQRFLEWLWYGDSPLSVVFSPLSRLYKFGLSFKERFEVKPATFPVPVVVVGNLTVGGTGKTPMAIYLARTLRDNGFRPGVISRGYGGRDYNKARLVSSHDLASDCGDEAVLLATESGCPVVICRDRLRAAWHLFKNSGVDVVISDDGLQRRKLPRHIEILMVDGVRGFGNGRLLPAGPLREPLSRIGTVDFTVVKGASWENCYRMDLQITGFVELKSGRELKPDAFEGQEIYACAAIGNPEVFFSSLAALGAKCRRHAFPDHHRFRQKDLVFSKALAVVMTQKDAMKCQGFSGNLWYAKVEIELKQDFRDKFLSLLKSYIPGGSVCE